MPNTTALWICAWTVSGLTTVPQSTAQTTRRTRTVPSLATSTSATCAMYVAKAFWIETPALHLSWQRDVLLSAAPSSMPRDSAPRTEEPTCGHAPHPKTHERPGRPRRGRIFSETLIQD